MTAGLFSNDEIGARLGRVYTILINLAKKRAQNTNFEEVSECKPKKMTLGETKCSELT
jgi:hypothetical protein